MNSSTQQKQKPKEAKKEQAPETEWFFEPCPQPIGWYRVTFPGITDLTVHLDSWLTAVTDWATERKVRDYVLAFLHTIPGPGQKRAEDHVTPVYFVRDQTEAASLCWRFKGVLAGQGVV
jgi:hypothetical protein